MGKTGERPRRQARMWWKRGLVLAGLAFLLAAPARAGDPLDADPYEWDPLRLIAGSDDLRRYTLGGDVWEVWVCDVPGGEVAVTPGDVAATLRTEVGPYFEWLAEGRYQPQFLVGAVVTAADESGCVGAVRAASVSQPDGVIVVADVPHDGGFGQPGVWCPILEWCARAGDTWPENFRSVYLDAYTVAGPAPNLGAAIHEIGHALHFPHSYSGTTAGTWSQYDNPIDVMSGADRSRPVGTLAVNRYAAGWLAPAQVEKASGGRFLLEPIGGVGTQLLVVPRAAEGTFLALDARVQDDYDAALPRAGVTVHRIDQRKEVCDALIACMSLSRRTQQVGGQPLGHLLGVGDSLDVDGIGITVVRRQGTGFLVDLVDLAPPVWSPTAALAVTGLTEGGFGLSWPAATDNVGVVEYRVYADGLQVAATAATKFSLTGVPAETTHALRVDAVDAAGNVAQGPARVVRTLNEGARLARHDTTTGRFSLQQADGTAHTFYFGIPGDVPMLCDWDGDGVDTVGLYRPAAGYLYLRNSNTIGFADVSIYYGQPEDRPLCGDWDGDGVDSIGIYRPSEAKAYLRDSNTQGLADRVLAVGTGAAFAGDWDGDGVDTVVMYDEVSGWVEGSGEGAWYVGHQDRRLLVGDFDGDGRESFSSFGEETFILSSGAGDTSSVRWLRFDAPGAAPLAGWWN